MHYEVLIVKTSENASLEICPRHDWTREQAQRTYRQPFADLLYSAQTVHRQCFDPQALHGASLMSIKTGGCPEDCGYCSQSARHKTNVRATPTVSLDAVIAKAREAKSIGATRLCLGAAWRSPNESNLETVCEMIGAVKEIGLETCATLGMLNQVQAQKLRDAGLDYYNHNIDTSERYYETVVSTRSFADRLQTLACVHEAGIKVCCGGIVGMGETETDRLDMLVTLATLEKHPQSVPINLWTEIAGTPMAGTAPSIEPFDLVRTIATARIMMPTSVVRLSAGRHAMREELQALCFLAGANAVFLGDHLLTTRNSGLDADLTLFEKLGLHLDV